MVFYIFRYANNSKDLTSLISESPRKGLRSRTWHSVQVPHFHRLCQTTGFEQYLNSLYHYNVITVTIIIPPAESDKNPTQK